MGINTKNKLVYIKDINFDPKCMDYTHIHSAYIPKKYYYRTRIEDIPLTKRNELIHPVGLVAARSLKYFSTNDEAFNIFRIRGMSVRWLRYIYNSFDWWSAYVVNAEGERKDWPMLYIGENLGSAKGNKVRKADIVISAFENNRCLINPMVKGGVVFAAGYSDRGGLFNSPDMYGAKLIVANKYKGSGVTVTLGVTKNLQLMAKHLCKNVRNATTFSNINEIIKKMKVVVLDRPRHKKLIKTIKSLGAQVILTKDDDLTPTLALIKDEIDLIIGIGGVPEAVLSAIIVENLGGEMSMRILPAKVARNEKLLIKLKYWDFFRKDEIDILKNFQIVMPGTEKDDEIPWNKVWTSYDLARGKEMVFTASIIKTTPWISFPDGSNVPDVEIERETGNITVHVVRIIKSKLEIIPVIYKTAISKYSKEYMEERNKTKRSDILMKFATVYTEFGLFQKAKESIQKVKDSNCLDKDLSQRADNIYEYVSALELITNKSGLTPETIIDHFEKAYHPNKWSKKVPGLGGRMIKRYYEYLGDTNYNTNQYDKALICYKKALNYSPHELKIYRKLYLIEMMDMIVKYFRRIDKLYRKLNFIEPKDWNSYKLKISLEVFYTDSKYKRFSCKNPWLIFFRKTSLHSTPPSFQMAILHKLLKLYNKLNNKLDEELITLLDKEFKMNTTEINIILDKRRKKKKFHCLSELYFIKELELESLTKLLFPEVKVASQNELEGSRIPLSITTVDAMERRTSNILEELREGYREDAQEYQYSLAESYHYIGLTFYDLGNLEGTKIYYDKAIGHFKVLVRKFEGLTPINAQYRIGDLCYELGLLFPKNQADYYKKSIDSYMWIINEDKFIKRFGDIQVLASTIRQEAIKTVEDVKDELKMNNKEV